MLVDMYCKDHQEVSPPGGKIRTKIQALLATFTLSRPFSPSLPISLSLSDFLWCVFASLINVTVLLDERPLVVKLITLCLNIFYSGIKYTEKDGCGL